MSKRFFFTTEHAEMLSFVAESDARNPFLATFVPVGTLLFFLAVSAIFLMGTSPQISPAVVECVVIAMVSFLIFLAPKDESMHGNLLTFFLPLHVKTARKLTPDRAPIPLIQPVKVFGIHNRILILRKSDEAVRFVQRLGDFVSLNTLFHRCTSNASNSAAILAYAGCEVNV